MPRRRYDSVVLIANETGVLVLDGPDADRVVAAVQLTPKAPAPKKPAARSPRRRRED